MRVVTLQRMKTKILLPITGALVALGIVAPPAQAAPKDKPLVYIFVLDGLDGDLYDQGRLPIAEGLVDKRGTYYQQSRAIMVAETNPNHTAMITGAYADTSGIPGNDFALYGNGAKSVDGCPLDAASNGPVGIGLAPGCVRAQTFFQSTTTKATRKKVTSAGIFGKPKLATLFAAKRSKKKYAADYLWTPCSTVTKTDYCGKAPTNSSGYADDKHTMDAVLTSVRKGVKTENGKRKKPNLTFVNLPTIDTTGHAYGAGSKYRKAASAADEQLDRFVQAAEEARPVVAHRDVPGERPLHGHHAGEVTLREVLDRGRHPRPSRSSSLQNGGTDMVYLADRTSPDRFDLLQRMRAAALATSGIDEALYREPNPADGDAANTLDGVHPGWHLTGERTGDLVVTHGLGGAFSDPINPTAGGHGGPYTTDNFFAITGGWKGLAKTGTVAGAPTSASTTPNSTPGRPRTSTSHPRPFGCSALNRRPTTVAGFLTEAFKGW